jgi:septum formation protein
MDAPHVTEKTSSPAAPPAEAGGGPKLILASRSPRRIELLREAGFAFEIDPADVDETVPHDTAPDAAARDLALRKAHVVARRHPDDIVLAADTVVALGTEILGKADDAAHAKQILSKLAGTTHLVLTGVCVMCRTLNLRLLDVVTSTVSMRALTDAELDAYVATGLWEGKAGAYGIQDNDPFVTRMDGSHTNIVGLPMERTVEMLAEAGVRAGRPAT